MPEPDFPYLDTLRSAQLTAFTIIVFFFLPGPPPTFTNRQAFKLSRLTRSRFDDGERTKSINFNLHQLYGLGTKAAPTSDWPKALILTNINSSLNKSSNPSPSDVLILLACCRNRSYFTYTSFHELWIASASP
ncbi:hypothetical protein D9613_011589 [Agrocybe pediades]|uniref:Uncharacterized protein n=1 Tax=Agrocybe pediades TaxID=84607 RepID=A0A8H4QX24_9AGAR|nr:hypothetical protein D9613_011589 [Agrocybe pediades]